MQRTDLLSLSARRPCVTVERVTDNGACYNFSPSGTRAGRLGLNYTRAKPYTPKNTGEAERLILREWAYAYAYNISKERDAELATMAAPLQLASGGGSRFVNQTALFGRS